MTAESEGQWQMIRQQIADGNFPAVIVTVAGKLALDGIGAELPTDIEALYPADVRDEAEQVAAIRQADVHAEALRQQLRRVAVEAERAAVIEEYRNQRVWRLAGHCIDELPTARWTYSEIATRLNVEGRNFRENQGDVNVICERPEGDFVINILDLF